MLTKLTSQGRKLFNHQEEEFIVRILQGHPNIFSEVGSVHSGESHTANISAPGYSFAWLLRKFPLVRAQFTPELLNSIVAETAC